MERNHTPFLQQVASYYGGKSGLADYCFVFPNRRSSQFFAKYLDEAQADAAAPVMQPRLTTISDFVADVAEEVTPNSVEALFLLHKAYTQLSGNEDYPFDKFVYWGSVILSDFNDVDMYLVNPKEIFTNIKEYKEISTDFLPRELKDELRQYINIPDSGDDDDSFWRQYEADPDGNDGEVKRNYLRLWQQLLPLYERFNALLASQQLSYTGKTYRDAALKLAGGSNPLPYDRYVFVGFNVLSNCELLVFSSLKKQGLADFFWDHSWPAMDNGDNLATRFISQYIKDFPEPADFTADAVTSWPQIETVAVPSNFGQAKYAFHIVDGLVNDKLTDPGNAINTAIVLPDENLFTPLVNSISSKVKSVNVTLGYPLRNADVVSLMHTVAKMHRQASRGAAGWTFYRDDVRNVLSHPIVKAAFGPEAIAVSEAVDNSNDFRVPETTFSSMPNLKPLFSTISLNAGVEGVKSHIDHLIEFVDKLNAAIIGRQSAAGTDDDSSDEADKCVPLQSAFIAQYRLVLQQVKDCIGRYGVPMCESTVFYLTDRLAGSHTIPFEGEPLHGLQIMGMLETRCLDFDNLIILSVNERVFPRRHAAKTFIANSLRHHFGMASVEHQESMSSYYFYRLLARARRVYLLYDSSAQAMGSGEPSRYIAQLEKVYCQPIVHKVVNCQLTPAEDYTLKVSKDDACQSKIAAYSASGDAAAYLSASSINQYVDCPLKFYLRHIQGLDDNTPGGDFMDASTLGTIVHDSLQELYYPSSVNGTDEPEHPVKPYKVTAKMIADFKRTKLDGVVYSNIVKTYLHDENSTAPLTGDAKILKVTISQLIENALNHDIELLKLTGADHFTVLECEVPSRLILCINGVKFNFYYRADRIDRIGDGGPVRIVDYKTGGDTTEFSSIDALFDNKAGSKRPHAILQLLLYSIAWKQEHPADDVEPVIYKLRDMSVAGVSFKPKRGDTTNHPQGQVSLGSLCDKDKGNMLEEFKEALGNRIASLQSTEQQFVQCPEKSTLCNYCRFNDLCKRKPVAKY